MIVKAVNRSRTPKFALDGAKMLFGDGAEYAEILHECFDNAWKDSSRRNRTLARSKGLLRETLYPQRLALDESALQAWACSIVAARNPAKEIGRVLAELDEASIRQVFILLKGNCLVLPEQTV